MHEHRFKKRTLFLWLYVVFALLPIYWMFNMSLRTNEEILSTFTLFPQHITFANYMTIFTDESWYSGYINSLIYVGMNTLISVSVALPAAYAFSRYSFLGDKHVFFWLLTNRMTPPAVFLLPFFQLYTTVGLMDTHLAVALAHLLFNVPLAVWILEGFMSGIPREIDETAYIDGYSFPRFFVRIFLPLIKAGKLKALGVTSLERSSIAMDLPTVSEELPGFDMSNWYGMLAPSATPKDVINKLSQEVSVILKQAALKEKLDNEGMTVVGNTPAQFDEFLKKETDKFAKIITSAGIKNSM